MLLAASVLAPGVSVLWALPPGVSRSFDITITNPTDAAVEAAVLYRLTDANGNKILEDQILLTVQPGSTMRTVTIEMTEPGDYVMHAYAEYTRTQVKTHEFSQAFTIGFLEIYGVITFLVVEATIAVAVLLVASRRLRNRNRS
jgi:hypothetical protein